MKYRPRRGLTLVELLIMAVMMAVLVAVVIPQFGTSTDDTRKISAEYHLSTVRSLIAAYRSQHEGGLPVVNRTQRLAEILTSKTTLDGTVDSLAGGYGPYLPEFPENSFSGSSEVKLITTDPPMATDVTVGNEGGWLYNPSTGRIWLDRNPGFDW